MAKWTKKRTLKWILPAIGVLVIGVLGWKYWQKRKNALPEGIASGNGRIEAKLVDIVAKEPLRIREILVNEGALVKPNQILVKLDTVTLEAELAEAVAEIDASRERLALAEASIVKQKSEIKLAGIENDRSRKLVEEGAGSQREADVRTTKLATTRASLAEAEAGLQTATQKVEAARAKAEAVKSRIEDATLRSPVTGRVLYRLAEPGEVLGPGGRALTLVNLQDVYMEIFLPSEAAARVKIGAEGRITVDYDPDHAVAGYVSFVSPEAQFTPKQVETKSEREKLMFRVKIQVPQDVAMQYVDRIKTGVRGVGYVKLDENALWPARLNNLIAPPRAGPFTQY